MADWAGVLLGASPVFMAYEGFQLLTYDYEEIDKPEQTLRRSIFLAILTVIGLYVLVTLGVGNLLDTETIVKNREISLAIAGEKAWGQWVKWIVSLAATFSTASAINATLFVTARLSRRVAHDNELPRCFEHENKSGIPDRAVLFLALVGGLLAMLGNLTQLVEAASLTFLFTFAVVNGLAFLHTDRHRWIGFLGAVAAMLAFVSLSYRLLLDSPKVFAVLVLTALLAMFGRHVLLNQLGCTDNEE